MMQCQWNCMEITTLHGTQLYTSWYRMSPCQYTTTLMGGCWATFDCNFVSPTFAARSHRSIDRSIDYGKESTEDELDPLAAAVSCLVEFLDISRILAVHFMARRLVATVTRNLVVDVRNRHMEHAIMQWLK